MSVFDSISSTGGGDIWSLGGMQFDSPISDILDKHYFTLEDLLKENDIIQETKSTNEKLIDFLSQDATIDQLITYIITPPDTTTTTDDFRSYKYPYMSCEIFSCECPQILNTFINNESHINKLFSIVDSEPPLNTYLAGYFEKVLEMLFRRLTIPVMTYINNAGTTLFLKFLNHIDNYSITQIIQRLMLPHIPFYPDQDQETMSNEQREQSQCCWSFSYEICGLLCNQMIVSNNNDVPSHISDLLITVLQLSPPDTALLMFICQSNCLDNFVTAAFNDNAVLIGNSDTTTDGSNNSSLATTISLASISVLESLISRLCESMSYGMIDPDELAALVDLNQNNIDKVCSTIQNHMPKLASQLNYYVTSNPCGDTLFQTKTKLPRLGSRCLQLVKLLESLIKINEPSIDDLLCKHEVLKPVLALMFAYELNSLLHLSVQRIILMIIESGDARRSMQQHLFVGCHFLSSIMSTIISAHTQSTVEASAASRIIGVDVGSAVSTNSSKCSSSSLLAGSRRPILGHLIQVAQSICNCENLLESCCSASGATSVDRAPAEGDICNSTTATDMVDSVVTHSVVEKTAAPASSTAVDLIGQWHDFVNVYLSDIVEKQQPCQPSSQHNDYNDYMAHQEAIQQALAKNAEERLHRDAYDDDDDDDDDEYDDRVDNVYRSKSYVSNTDASDNFANFANFDSEITARDAYSSSTAAGQDASHSTSASSSSSSNVYNLVDPFADSSASTVDPFADSSAPTVDPFADSSASAFDPFVDTISSHSGSSPIRTVTIADTNDDDGDADATNDIKNQ